MATLIIITLGVAGGVILLATFRMHYNEICREYDEDAGWHRMWHERIYETTDETDGREEPA